MKNAEHLGLGAITGAVGLSKSNLMEAAKLGAGAATSVTLADLLQSRLLVRNGAPMIPMAWSPLATAVFGFLAGGFARRKIDASFGDGMVAGGVGMAVSALIARYSAPAVSVTQEAGSQAEEAGAAPQAVAGFGFGRAFAPSLGAMAGLGNYAKSGGPSDSSHVYGVGTPDMSAMGMFGGANVAIEERTALSGANVAIEDTRAFAGAFTG